MHRGDNRQPEFLDFFVGREAELGRLENAVENARQRPGRLHVLCGEPGVGKSRLAAEFSSRAAARRARVLWARWNARGTRRLSVFGVDPQNDSAEVLVSEVTLAEDDIIRAGARLRAFVQSFIAWNPPNSHDPRGGLAIDTRLHDSGAQPLVLILDDLRASDTLSIPLLRAVARELQSTPSMILAIYDDAQVFNLPHFAEMLRSAVAPSDRITLPHLSESEVSRVIAHAFGHTAGPDELAAVYRITRGDPGAVKRVIPMLRMRERERLAKRVPQRLASEPAPGSQFRSVGDKTERRLITREADYWTLVRGTLVLRLRHVKGLTYLSHLLLNPGQYFHVLDLVALEQKRVAEVASNNKSNAESMQQVLAGLRRDSGPVLDNRARLAYAQRLRDLTEELERASHCNDGGTVERLREEQAFLTRELTRSTGLGGRTRATNSPAERARVSVTHAIRAVVRKVRTLDADLARHFSIAVRTGIYCAYVPDRPTEQRWRSSSESTRP